MRMSVGYGGPARHCGQARRRCDGEIVSAELDILCQCDDSNFLRMRPGPWPGAEAVTGSDLSWVGLRARGHSSRRYRAGLGHQ